MDLSNLGHFLIEYRYPALFLASLIEGPFVAFFAGTLASAGYFNIYILAVFFFARDLLFDAGYYMVGYFGSATKPVRKLLTKVGVSEAHLHDIRKVWENHAFRSMFLGKISYGIAPAFIVTAGTIRMSLRKFFQYGALVALIQYWGLLFIGYFFGNSLGGNLSKFLENLQYVLGIGGLLITAYYIFSWYIRGKFLDRETDIEIDNEMIAATASPTKISFIVPTLNEGTVLEPMLTSIRTLTKVPYEIIVSDGGSKDGTLEIAHRLANKVVENTSGKRQNIAIGRNEGAKVAEGEFLVFMDADVFIANMNAFFSRALAYFHAHPECAGYVVYLEVLQEHRTFADAFFHGMYNRWLYFMNNILHSPLSQGEFQMMPAKFYTQTGGYNETIAASEDMEIFMRLAKLGTIHVDTQLRAAHTGRRAHKIGWIKMLSLWTVNGIMVKARGRSVSKEWTPIR